MRNLVIVSLAILALPQVSLAASPSATLIALVEPADSDWVSPAFPNDARAVAMDLQFASLSQIAGVTILGENAHLPLSSHNSRWCVDASCSAQLLTSRHKLVIHSGHDGWTATARDVVFASGTVDLGEITSVQLAGIEAKQVRAYSEGALIDTTFAAGYGGFSEFSQGPSILGGHFSQTPGGPLVVSSGHTGIRAMIVAPPPGARWLLQQDVALASVDSDALGGFALAAGVDASLATLWRVGITRGVEADLDNQALFRITLRVGDTVVPVGTLAPLLSTNQWSGRVTIIGDEAQGGLTIRFVDSLGSASTMLAPVGGLSSTAMLGFGDADVLPSLDADGLSDDGAGRASYSGAVLAQVAHGVGP